MASNPAFNRIEKDAQSGYAGFGGQGYSSPSPMSAQPNRRGTSGASRDSKRSPSFAWNPANPRERTVNAA